MEVLPEDFRCHVCLESEVKNSPGLNCSTHNCNFSICDDCKRRYFVEQQQQKCPGCRQQSIDLKSLPQYQLLQITLNENNNNWNFKKIFKILVVFIVSTVLAYLLGSSILIIHSLEEPVLFFVLRIIIGYFLLFIIGGFLYLCCYLP